MPTPETLPPPLASTLLSDDGLRLHLQLWPVLGARGTVVLVHGLGEHLQRHAPLARRLQAAGWQVLAHDQRGHGRSDGARGRLAAADDLLRDLGRVLQAVTAVGPCVLLGHSMGGTVAARFVAEGLAARPAAWWRPVDGLALSSPALAADLRLGQRLLLAVAGRLLPNLAAANGLPRDALSRDPQVVAAYRADALVHDRISPRLARFILDSGHQVRRQAPHWTCPTLLLWAGADRCVAPRGSEAFAAAAPRPMLSTQCFPALFHEIFNEPERELALTALLRWLDQRWPG